MINPFKHNIIDPDNKNNYDVTTEKILQKIIHLLVKDKLRGDLITLFCFLNYLYIK